ncbi:MAG: hypothetical protein CM15mP49_20270 [Actinomycetota bacterium]|nr:MAG: hypothetical protein CM15mP49_20270 [Actinomycetota bacterium]
MFFTNYQSDKAASFQNSPNVSLTFGWFPNGRGGFRILGTIEKAQRKNPMNILHPTKGASDRRMVIPTKQNNN